MTKRNTTVAAMTAVVLWLAGCNAPPSIEPPAQAPAYQTIAESHNQRLAKLERLEANGVIEIRWRDEKGKKHFEQGNAELWLRLPSRTALRVEKLGELLLWLGSDDQRYWLFDLTRDEKVLYTGAHGERVNYEQAGALGVRPLVLLDLLALTPLPAGDGQSPPPEVQFDSTSRAWMLETAGRSGRIRMYFDPQTLLPSRVEALDEAGIPKLFSSLRRYESVQMHGVPPLALPKLAHLADISAVDDPQTPGDQAPSGEVKLVLDDATTVVDDAVLGRVFDFDRLMRGLKPDRVEGEIPPRQARMMDVP